MIEGYNCVYNEADKGALKQLSGPQYKILRYLCARANEFGVAYPTAREIAQSVGCSERHVWRVLPRLVALGYIACLRKGEFDRLTGRRTPNYYQVSLQYRRVAPQYQHHAESLWDDQLPYDSISKVDPEFTYGNQRATIGLGSHDIESTTESVKESIKESKSGINQESTTPAPQAAVDLPLNKGEAEIEPSHSGTTAGAQALRAEAANAAENQGEGQDKSQPSENGKKTAKQPAGQKQPTPHSPPPDDETQTATVPGYFEPASITTPLENTAEALATRLYEIGIPRPLGRALIQHYGFFEAEQALLQTHAATRAGIAHTPSGLYRYILQKPRIDPGVEKNTKRRRKKSQTESESDYTGGKYAGIIES